MYARGHAHCRMVNISFPLRFCISPLGWLQPQCLCYAKRSPVKWHCGHMAAWSHASHSPRSPGGTCIHHTHASTLAPRPAAWWNITSIRLEGKNNKTLDTTMQPHTEQEPLLLKLWKLIPCFLVLSFSTGQFSSLVFLCMYPCRPARPLWPLSAWCEMFSECAAELRWAVGTGWQPKWTSHAKA